jgi:uncharacterized protein
MAASNTIDLARLQLRPGEGRRLELEVDPGSFEYGGQSYAPAATSARLDISRMAVGHALRLRFTTTLEGPCMRCLEDASVGVPVDAREVNQPGGGEDLESPYIEGDQVRLGAWAHDALALALPVPARLLCREDCAGLCPVCGKTLNDAEPGAHDHAAEPDPRWAKLGELELE